MRIIGFTKGGFHVSNAVIIAGAIIPAILPAQTAANSSPVDVLTGKYNPNLTMAQRANLAFASYVHTGLGYSALLKDVHGGSPNTKTQGFGVMAVGGGVAMKFASKFVNPFLGASPVKL